MKWFRMHHEARTDKKLAVLTDRQHRIWFDLLCFASEQKERGVIRDYSRQLLAVEVANGDVAALEDTLVTLVTLRCISLDDDTITFLNFKKRQYDHPSDLPENVKGRVEKHRNEEKTQSTQGETPKRKSVTTLKRHVTTCNEIDTDTEADTDSENSEVPHGTSAVAADAANGAKAATINQQMWAVLRDELGHEPHPSNKSERGKWNGAIKSLLNVGETPDTLADLIKRYIDRWPEIDCTPSALVTHHSLIRSAPPAKANNNRASPARPEPEVHYADPEERRRKEEEELRWAAENTTPPSWLQTMKNGSSAPAASAGPRPLPRSVSG